MNNSEVDKDLKSSNPETRKISETPKLAKNPFVVPLTDEELESLKQWKKEVSAYFRKAFQNEIEQTK